MRKLEPYKDYFWDFYNAQKVAVQTKIDYVLYVIMTVEHIPKKFFKHIEDGIYEIRIQHGSNVYRVFSFFEENRLIILLHGFTKKSQKLPRREIEKAIRLRRDYYEDKESGKHK